MKDYERKRLRFLLDELFSSTRGNAGAVRFDEPASGQTLVRGVATREGVVRLGIELAWLAAHDNADLVYFYVRRDGAVSRDEDRAVMELELADDSAFPELRPSAPSLGYRITCGVAIALLFATLALALIGLVSILVWLGVGKW